MNVDELPEPYQTCVCHQWEYEDDEYDSLGNGGSYAIYRCVKCDARKYEMLPD